MELISYEQFGKLRLRDFIQDPAAVGETTDWEWMGSSWVNEGIGFTSFSRHASTPDETGGLELSFPELSSDTTQQILAFIGLPVHPGMRHDQVRSCFGEPITTHQFVRDRRTYDFTVGSAQPYIVRCTVQETDGLIHVSVVRPDLISRDERIT
jgi:hypothetical protein